MGYQINGKDITNLCEVAWGSGDSRTKSDFNTSDYHFNGDTRASKYPDNQFITYAQGYLYGKEGLKGKFSGFPTFQKKTYTASARGHRPVHKYRYSTSTAGTYYINKFADGEIWVSTSSNSRSGTKICTTSQDWKGFFLCIGGAGGGGGGGTALASGGGGGGGSYGFFWFGIEPANKFWISVGSGGSGGSGGGNGSNGGWSRINRKETSSADYYYTFTFYSGIGGSSGSNDGTGGSGGQPETSLGNGTAIWFHPIITRAGGNGGLRNIAGGNSFVNFKNYTPEKETITYMTGLGGAGGGSSGGGGGGGSPLGHGGKGGTKTNGANGMICGGGGGGGYKAFSSTTGGKGGNAYIAIYY